MYIIGAGSGGVVFYIYHQEDVPVRFSLSSFLVDT
jgi:hypothetical protein